MLADVKIIGHRGASFEAPENTVAAVHLAWQERADGVEVDVRMSLDQRAVVIHDDSTMRTTGRDLRVADQLWEVLRCLDAGSWKAPRWNHAGIPLLRDLFKIIPGGRRLFVEIKCGPEIIPALVKDVEVNRPAPGALCFLGFDPAVMTAVKRALPTVDAYLNVEPRGQRGAPSDWTADGLARRARQLGLDGLSVGYGEAVDAEFIQGVLATRLGLAVWTVNDEHVALRLQAEGLPWLMTDKPAYLRHRLRSHGAS